MGNLEQDRQIRIDSKETYRTGQAERDRLDITGGKRQADKTDLTGQAEWDRQIGTSRTGNP